MDENENNNPNDDSGIRESIKDFFNNEEDMKNELQSYLKLRY